MGNSHFVKKDNHLITYQSGGCSSQVDYILFKKRDFKLVKDVKVIPGEECAAQHRLLVGDLKVMFSKPTKQPFVPRRRVWKLKEPASKDAFVAALDKNLGDEVGRTVDDIWGNLKSGLLNATEEVCGWSKKGNWRRQTWWWDKTVSGFVSEKRRLRNAWKQGGSKDDYISAKRRSKHAVFQAKKRAEERKMYVGRSGEENIFRIAKQMRKENADFVGDKCVRDDSGNLDISEDAKNPAWKQQYERLLNVEFPWAEDMLPAVEPISGPPILVSSEMVLCTLRKMKSGKAAGPSRIVGEMLKSPDVCSRLIADICNAIVK